MQLLIWWYRDGVKRGWEFEFDFFTSRHTKSIDQKYRFRSEGHAGFFGSLFSANPIRSHLTHAELESQMAIIIILMTAMCQSYFVLCIWDHFELHSLHELRVLVYAWSCRTRRFLGRIFLPEHRMRRRKGRRWWVLEVFLPIFSPLWLSSSLRVFTGHALSCE